MRQIRMLLSWCLAVFLIGILVHFLGFPWIGESDGAGFLRDAAGDNAFFAGLADLTGLKNFEPFGRYVFAGFGVVAAVCLLIPPMRKGGAWLAVLFFAGLAGLLVWPDLRSHVELQERLGVDADALLYLNLTSITAAFLLLAVHPSRSS